MSREGKERGSNRPAYGRRRRDVLKVLGIGGATALAGCSGGTNQATSTGTTGETTTTTQQQTTTGKEHDVHGHYDSAVSSDASTLDFYHESSVSEGNYVGLVLDGTWALKDGPEVFPLWITPSTDDGRVWHMKLRENLQWGGDYGQMTAEDWVYNIENVFQADWSGYVSATDWHATNPDTGKSEPIPVEKTGKYTFDIKLFETDPLFPYKPTMWGTYIAPKALVKKYADEKDVKGLKQDDELNSLSFGGNLGPYTLDDWQRKSQYKTTRNDSYYLAEAAKTDDSIGEQFTNAPYFTGYTYHVINEQSARLGALQKGTIDYASIPPSKVDKYKSMDSVDLYTVPQPFAYLLKYNMRANGWTPFRKREVRQALAYAVDKQKIVQGAWRNYADVAQTMQPKWSKWYSDQGITTYGVGDDLSKEKCQSKLADALSDTEYSYDGDKLVDGDGQQVALDIVYNPGTSSPKKTVCQLIKAGFETRAGIQVNLKTVNGSTFVNKYAHNSPPDGTDVPWSSGPYNGGPRDVSVSENPWDMSLVYALNTYPLTPSSAITPFFEEQSGFNYYGYVPSDGVDFKSLMNEASSTTDESKLKEVYGKAFKLVNEEQPFGFLAMPSDHYGYNPKVAGPTNSFFIGWDSASWYFKQ